MKTSPVKQTIYFALLLFAAGCFFSSCFKSELLPKTAVTVVDTTGGTPVVVAVDTLPSFSSPAGVAVDAGGNIYVADYGNNLIRKIAPGGLVSTLAGSGFQGSNNAAGNLASFNKPSGIAIDAAGNLYIADSGNNAIRKIGPGGTVTTLAGSDSTGSANGRADTASFFSPAALAVDGSGNVYVADAGNNLIRLINTAGVVSTFAGAVSTVTSNGTLSATSFNNPTGIAVNGSGNVFVANYLNNNILMVNPAGTVSIFAGSTKGTQGAANGQDSTATFYYPNSVAADAAGNIYVSDGINNLIRKITPGGLVSTLAGSGATGAVDSVGTAASFNNPAGLALDATGNVYVADSGNNLIRKITPAGVVTTIAGNGRPGAKNGQAVAHRNVVPLKSFSRKAVNIWVRPRVR